MKFTTAILAALVTTAASATPLSGMFSRGHSKTVSPKVLIISMFEYEEVWSALDLNTNYTLPGLSPLYPAIHCNKAGEICQMTTGEAEINAAVSVTSMLLSPVFDFSKTYL